MEINGDTQKVSLQWQVISSEHMDQLHCAVKYFSQLIHTFFCRYFCRSLSQLHQWFFSCWGAVVVSRTNRNIITSPSSQTKNHFFPNLDFPTWLAAREIFEIFLVAGISPWPVVHSVTRVQYTALHSLVTVSTINCLMPLLTNIHITNNYITYLYEWNDNKHTNKQVISSLHYQWSKYVF